MEPEGKLTWEHACSPNPKPSAAINRHLSPCSAALSTDQSLEVRPLSCPLSFSASKGTKRRVKRRSTKVALSWHRCSSLLRSLKGLSGHLEDLPPAAAHTIMKRQRMKVTNVSTKKPSVKPTNQNSAAATSAGKRDFMMNF